MALALYVLMFVIVIDYLLIQNSKIVAKTIFLAICRQEKIPHFLKINALNKTTEFSSILIFLECNFKAEF